MRSIRRWSALLAIPAFCTAVAFGPSVPAASASPAAGTCSGVYIKNYETGLFIEGGGVNQPVELTGDGNCFSQKYPFPDPFGGTGYEYQNGLGHCLWQDAGVIELGGACKAGHENEEFYGVNFVKSEGWQVSNMANGGYMYADTSNGQVYLGLGNDGLWNFPDTLNLTMPAGPLTRA